MVMRKVETPAEVRPVIHALLKPRWDLEPSPRRFVAGGREVLPDEQLPEGTRIDYLVSRLREVPRKSLSPPEKKLARWVQIVLPKKAEAEKYVAELQAWPCFAEVHIAPTPSLPMPMQVPRP